MARITFLGGEETGNVATTTWGPYTFTLNQPVEVTDRHIIAKARANRFFRVDGNEAGVVVNEDEPDPVTATNEAGEAVDAEILEPDDPVPALLKMADDAPFLAFRAEAMKVLGDDTPVKKADIIAALQAWPDA